MLSVAFLFESRLITFPTTRQDTDSSCGSAAVQSVLRYYGIDERQDDLSKKLEKTQDGINYSNIVKLFKKYNLEVEAGPMDQQILKNNIRKKIPVIILIQAYKYNKDKKYSRDNYNDGHYVVIIGYDDKRFIVEDPALNNEIGYIPFSELNTRWHGIGEDKNEKLDFFGIAVFGKEPKYESGKLTKVK